MLEVRDLSMRFGGLLAVDGVSLNLNEREIFSIIGPNGAGKTTVFNCISGFYRPTGGEIQFNGHAIHSMPDYRIARLGMVRTFQHVRLFNRMTPLENLMVAQHHQVNTNLFAGLFKTPSYRHREQEAMDRAVYWLKKVNLLELANREAGNLAYGQQRRLEIARCMVTGPKLLMLDEPAAGLNPRETRDLNELIVSLKEDYNVAVLLIEHDMGLVMGISDRIAVINQGRPLAQGTPDEIRCNPDVIKAYLGEE
ncbi:high-affinity branched-chain amino acid ABC transporter ATP-binding protein LivG [Mangrovitalea sediminis]|uniref:high-affinity branched-chain amino acid ABC transporter ATP-binding protein LivG n=1 Tax=Mangrovitalea sediminis TaxID=1982043 RepID=UPI000BE4DA97|nr:high-affinity branched-chain amino acid ABC transporter ATP-binding protein LivG [Mangrovitalea sediminis]